MATNGMLMKRNGKEGGGFSGAKQFEIDLANRRVLFASTAGLTLALEIVRERSPHVDPHAGTVGIRQIRKTS